MTKNLLPFPPDFFIKYLASSADSAIIADMKAVRNPANITNKSPALVLRNRLTAFSRSGAGLCINSGRPVSYRPSGSGGVGFVAHLPFSALPESTRLKGR
jgi:hypothetical protein